MITVAQYINKRYDRWLDYAVYHCAHAGMTDEANDVLNEVLYSVLKKDPSELTRLLSLKKNGYTELDFFVLRMIKLNATSDTSPYRSKYRNKLLYDVNKDYMDVKIIDEPYVNIDNPALMVWRTRLIRFIIKHIEVPQFDKAVFEYRFISNEMFSSLDLNLKALYCCYNRTLDIINAILLEMGLIKPFKKERKCSKPERIRINGVVRNFMDKIDKQLLERIKKYNVMEDEELDLEKEEFNNEGENQENDPTKDWSVKDFVDAFNRDTAKEPGCASLELE